MNNILISQFYIDDFRFETYETIALYSLKIIHIKSGIFVESGNLKMKSRLVLREYLLLILMAKLIEIENNLNLEYNEKIC